MLGNSKVKGQFGRLNPALNQADAYLELSFDGSLGNLNPGSSTGNIQYRIAKADWSQFNQSNDHSYVTNPGLAQNGRVVIYVGQERVWGQEPGARLGAEPGETDLDVVVLGNPVTGSNVSVEVRGAGGQPLRLTLTDVLGRTVSERFVDRAGALERQTLRIGQRPAGVLLLQVSTPTQSRSLKVVKAE